MDSSSTYTYKPENTTGELPCESCGKPVVVIFPYVGCVYCGDCISATDKYYLFKKDEK